MSKRTVIFDSSVWIAYFHKHDLHHDRALRIFNRYSEFNFLVPEIVYFETLVKVYKLTESYELLCEVHDKFRISQQVRVVKIESKRLDRLLLANIQKVTLKSSDFQILLYTLEYDESEFQTFDKKLLKAYLNLKNYD